MSNLQDLASERAVLAALCQYGLDCLLEADFIDADYFSDDTNRILFNCMYPIVTSGGKVELAAILSKADELGFIKLINKQEEIGYIRSLFNFPISKDNILYYAAKLAKLKVARDIKHTLRTCSKKIEDLSGEEDIQDIVSIVEAPLLDLTTKVTIPKKTSP